MTTATSQPVSPVSASMAVLWVIALCAGAWFLARNVPHYLVLSEASYGSYYWPRVNYLFPHILGGLIAIIIGPFQFWGRFRAKYPAIHRTSGRIYLLAILIGSIGSFGLTFTITKNLSYASGLGFMAVAWLTTSSMAFLAIKKRNFTQHKQWMIRSYVVTFSFVTFRILQTTLHAYGLSPNDYMPALAWGSWAVPLLFTEVAIQRQQARTAR